MPRLKIEDTCTLSIRLPTRLYEHIGQSAQQQGITRTEYLLSWLPDTHASTAPTPQNTSGSKAR